MRKKLSVLAGMVLALSGCSGGSKIEEYKGRTPEMDVRDYFNGDVEAQGVFLNREGVVEEQFSVKMHGDFDDKGGKMHEAFVYADGHTQERTWTIVMQDDNHFTGTAFDVVGAAQGQQVGNAANMKYVLRVPYKGSTIDLNMDDWLYRLDHKTAINRVKMTKYGFRAGELLITFRKKS